MSNWSSGYVTDIGYTFGYYQELNPLNIKLAFLNAGLAYPEIGTACDLGFGQGLSANIHASASMTQWVGTDFNPTHAHFAQELAKVSGAKASFYDESFEQFCTRDDLPEFDYIGIHGVLSWVSAENRSIIVDFVRKKLKVGGVLYISYNTLPGWSNFAPMRQLMNEHLNIMGSEGEGVVKKIDHAINFAQEFLGINPLYLKANPASTERLTKMSKNNRHYLAHEYFNRDWHPMYFADVNAILEPAKVTYACSANYLDHVDSINLTADQQSFIAKITHAGFKESVRDFLVNQTFRKDYWVKGPRKLSTVVRTEQLRNIRLILIHHRPDISLKLNSKLGEASLSEAIYLPILDMLADHKIKSIGQIAEVLSTTHQIDTALILEALVILVGSGHVALVSDEANILKAKKHTDKLNLFIIKNAKSSGDINYLASPVLGGGIAVDRFQQLFIQAYSQGKKQPLEWAHHVWNVLQAQGQKIMKEEVRLETAEDNLNELTSQAQMFLDKRLPILKALQVI